MTVPTAAAPAPAKPLVWLFVVMLLTALWFTTRGWHAAILDRHAFRQTQTAISAYWMKEAGVRLDYETPLFGPPWSLPMEFPLYQGIVAKVSAALGTGLEPTARGVSLFFFLAALPAVYGLGGLLRLAPSRRLLVLSVILASPTYLFWSRTFMIETTALCFSTWFLLTAARAVRDGRWRYSAVAAVFAVLAALTKITTFLVFCPPAVALCFWLWRERRRTGTVFAPFVRSFLLGALPVLVALIGGRWWVHFGDQLKQTNPFSVSLTSAHMTRFNWGTLEQRLSARFWSGVWDNFSGLMLGEAAMAVVLIGLVLAAPVHRRVALWCFGFFVTAFLLFSNLYYAHDYYFCANSFFLLGGAGLVLVSVWDHPRLPLAARGLMLALFFSSQLLLYSRQFGRYHREELPPPPEIATIIRDVVPADGVLLIYGWDWNSLVPYYARRRAVMVPENRDRELRVLEGILARLPPRRIAALLLRHTIPAQYTADFIRERTERFGLAATPVASSPDGDLYLPKDQVAAAIQLLAGRDFATVSLKSLPPPDFYAAALQPVDSAVTALPIFAPHPSRGRTLYGMGPGEVDGHPMINAHAPSELEFIAPAGATHIEAIVGLPEKAYTSPTPTDGVDILIFERLPDGHQRVLFQRNLDPLHRPEDRGPQTIAIDLDQRKSGPLVFGVYPGLAHNPTCDWAYWRSITIH